MEDYRSFRGLWRIMLISIFLLQNLSLIFLTNYCEINPHIPCGRVLKVYATPIDSLILQLDIVDEQLSGMRCSTKEGTIPERSWR